MAVRTPSSTLRRAVLPVAAGIGVFAVIGLLTWGIAAILSRHPATVKKALASPTFDVGNARTIAPIISEEGPLLFQGLIGDSADKSLVLDHTGADALRGWVVYYAHPADGDPTCKVSQVKHTRTFTDCTGRQLQVEQLAPPDGVYVLVSSDGALTIDLQRALAAATTSTTPGSSLPASTVPTPGT